MTKALESLDRSRSLSELNPRIGEKVQIETRAPRTRYSVQLLGYRENGSMMVSAPKNAAVNAGAQVTVRLMTGNFICAFSARILKIQTTPFGYWHLEYPKETEIRRIRSHTRVPVNLLVSVDEFEQGKGFRHDWPVSAYCTDISLSGACIDASVALGKQGDKLFITTRFSVAGVDQIILTPALLRSVTPQEGSVSKVVSHGLEFLDMDDDTHLILAGFVYQQFLIETGNLEILGV